MSRRAIGLAAAVALALIGTVALVAFVAGAEERALEGEQLVEVFVVTEPIPGGTPGDDVEDYVTVEEVPAKVRPDNAVDSLAGLQGRVASIDLAIGEQLLEPRFVAVSDFASREVGVAVPDDMVEVTVALDPERAVGGLVEPGQTVSVFASFEPFEISTLQVTIDGDEVVIPPAGGIDEDAKTSNTTDLILHKVLVTAVQEQQGTAGAIGAGVEEVDRLQTAPSDRILVTLAVHPNDAERVVFTSEFGLVWLAIERDTVPDDADSIKTRLNIYGENGGSEFRASTSGDDESSDDSGADDDAATTDDGAEAEGADTTGGDGDAADGSAAGTGDSAAGDEEGT